MTTIQADRILKVSPGGFPPGGWLFVVYCPECGAMSIHTSYGSGVACLCGAKYNIAEPPPGWQERV